MSGLGSPRFRGAVHGITWSELKARHRPCAGHSVLDPLVVLRLRGDSARTTSSGGREVSRTANRIGSPLEPCQRDRAHATLRSPIQSRKNAQRPLDLLNRLIGIKPVAIARHRNACARRLPWIEALPPRTEDSSMAGPDTGRARTLGGRARFRREPSTRKKPTGYPGGTGRRHSCWARSASGGSVDLVTGCGPVPATTPYVHVLSADGFREALAAIMSAAATVPGSHALLAWRVRGG